MTTNFEISLSPISAKGDIISSDGSSRIRIPAGTNGQVIISQSTSSSGISCYTQPTPNTGSFDLISTATVTTEVASITINLETTDSNYRAYEFVGSLRSSFTTTSVPSFGVIQFENVTSAYFGATLRTGSTVINKRTTTSGVSSTSTNNFEPFVINTSGHSSNMFSPFRMYFWSNYQIPELQREMIPVAIVRSSALDAGAASGLSMMHASTILTTTSVEYPESITLFPGSGANFSVGSKISLYGYKRYGA